MAEPTYESVMKAMRAAHEAGDTESASRLATMAMALQNAPEPAPDRSQRPKWTENIWGKGEIDTVGEDVGAALGAGLESGAATLAGAPGSLANQPQSIVNWLQGEGYGPQPDDSVKQFWGIKQAREAMDKAGQEMGGPSIDYEPQTLAGDYAKTTGEFIPAGVTLGAGAAANAPQALKLLANTSILPAAASETAGQVTEGTAIEPLARAVAAMTGTTGLLKSTVDKLSGGYVSPAHKEAVNTLKDSGVNPTAGQASGSTGLLYAEDATNAGQQLQKEAMQSYTDAAMDKIIPPSLKKDIPLTKGAPANRTLAEMQDGIGRVMDDLSLNNSIPDTTAFQKTLADVADEYAGVVSAGGKSPFFEQLATNPNLSNGISGAEYQALRSQIGRMTKSADAPTREAAVKTLSALDDAMEQSIKAGGNKTDLTRYRDARTAWRNQLVIEDSLSTAAGRGTEPLVTPSSLANASKKQNKREWVRGESTFNDLARAGEDVMTMARSSGTAERGAAQNMGIASAPAGVGALVGHSLGGYEGAIIGGSIGAATPYLRNRALAMPTLQNYLKNTLITGPQVQPMGTMGLLQSLRRGATSQIPMLGE